MYSAFSVPVLFNDQFVSPIWSDSLSNMWLSGRKYSASKSIDGRFYYRHDSHEVSTDIISSITGESLPSIRCLSRFIALYKEYEIPSNDILHKKTMVDSLSDFVRSFRMGSVSTGIVPMGNTGYPYVNIKDHDKILIRKTFVIGSGEMFARHELSGFVSIYTSGSFMLGKLESNQIKVVAKVSTKGILENTQSVDRRVFFINGMGN